MIKSMTGFGREHTVGEKRELIVEIRSVNHRYYEFTSRTPRTYGYLDEKLKTFLKSGISRGKVEVSVSIYNLEGTDAEIEINLPVAKGYVNALRGSAEELGLSDDLALTSLLRMSDIFTVVKKTEDEEVIWNEVKEAASAALDRFIEMRVIEGQKMYEDINSRLDTIEKAVAFIEEEAPKSVQAYHDRLYNKIKENLESLGKNDVDEQRIVTEVAVFSDKVAVDEETVRLRSHIAQFRELLKSEEPVGRKLDFLVQEMNREINTTGSKCNDIEITRTVVEVKAEIEKIREQIQNIE